MPRGVRVSFRSGADSSVVPAKAAMEAHAMVNIRHSFHMQIDLGLEPSKPIWSEGISLKVFNLEYDDPAQIYRADIDAYRDHYGFVEQPFEDGFERFMHFMTSDEAYSPGLWFLAMDGDQIDGICINRNHSHEDPEIGWVSSLSILHPWRNRGIGLVLLQ